MSAESTSKFIGEIRGRVEYFRDEFDITYAEAVGVLDIVKHELLAEVLDEDSGDQGGEGF